MQCPCNLSSTATLQTAATNASLDHSTAQHAKRMPSQLIAGYGDMPQGNTQVTSLFQAELDSLLEDSEPFSVPLRLANRAWQMGKGSPSLMQDAAIE